MQTLRDYRESKGIKLQTVAEHLGVTRQTYRAYEKNQSSMSVTQATSVCELLGCSPDEIFFGLKGQQN